MHVNADRIINVTNVFDNCLTLARRGKILRPRGLDVIGVSHRCKRFERSRVLIIIRLIQVTYLSALITHLIVEDLRVVCMSRGSKYIVLRSLQ